MSDDPAQKAIDAIIELIVLTLRSDAVGRFAEASRLCTLGQALIRSRAKSVKEIRELDGQDRDDGGVQIAGGWINANPGPVMPPVMPRAGVLNQYGNGYNDQAELQRNLMLTIGPIAQVLAEAQRGQLSSHEAGELKTLLELKEKLPYSKVEAVDARINKLIENMEARNDAKCDAKFGVADPVVPRGHPIGEPGGENDPPRLRAHVVGGEGDGGAPGAGAGAGVLP
jgi:hypothetical protein